MGFEASEKKNVLILVVDDNPANIQVVGSHLRKSNIDIAIATSGEKALHIANTRQPDLILLDVMMPDMNGFDVCVKLKENPLTKDIPVIFLTAKVAEYDIIKGFNLGAVDYITKPFNSSELVVRVNNHLNLKNYRDQLENQNRQLERINQEKNEFIGIASHDLKNPVNNISMLAKLIRDDDEASNEEIKDFANDIITTTERMLHLVKNLLDINAIEQGKVEVFIENINLEHLVINILNNYEERAAKKGIKLQFINNTEKPLALADRTLSVQVMDNLVSNAIKFSPKNKTVYISLDDKGLIYLISIKDEGPGLSPEDISKLFKKFQKLGPRPTGGESSNGLGLSIVKKYMEMMNGNVWCESTKGEGSTFIIELPKKESISQ